MKSTQIRKKQTILIVDDTQMNRAILADMLGDGYEILEAENGLEAVGYLKKLATNIDLLLLDIMMPFMDGFEVLAVMNQSHMISDIPVIMISAESASSYVERAYEMGVTDYISRPFNARVVQKRVENTLMLYAKQKRLVHMVEDQIYEKEKNNDMMVNILSHIVEFRNGESGLHILHIHTMTEILLRQLCSKTDRYGLTREDIARISTASALHDVGKISVPDSILNKPGRLTEEEFHIMKSHSEIGARMLSRLPVYKDEPFIRTAYEICRWHHERYDGKGYPDGLKGDEIPISAQIVSLADVYDALTSERCYKKAFSHEKAMEMILDGACGAINPLLLECFKEVQGQIREELHNPPVIRNNRQICEAAGHKLYNKEPGMAGDNAGQMEIQEEKKKFFLSKIPIVSFEYSAVTGLTEISGYTADALGPEQDVLSIRAEARMDFTGLAAKRIAQLVLETTPEDPDREEEMELKFNGISQRCRVMIRTLWSKNQKPRYLGTVGVAVNI